MSGATFWSSQDLGLDPRWYDDGRAARAPLGDAVRDTFDEASSFTSGVLSWIGRGSNDAQAAGTLFDEIGQQVPANPEDPLLTVEEANARYGIPGQLQFSRPLAESSAIELHGIRRRDLARQDRMARAEKGVLGYGAIAAAGLAGSIIDPLNIASAFIPVVGPTRAAAWMAQAGTRVARAGVAARIGVIEGAAGAALLEPLQWGMASAESRDYGAADTLLNVAFGAVMGGLLHAGGRAAVDGWRGWRAPDPEAVRSVHEAAMRAAAAQMEMGEPVNVAPLIEAARMADASNPFRAGLLGGAARLAPDAEGVWRVQPAAGPALTPERVAGLPVSEDPGQAALAREVDLRGAVRAPVLDSEGQPVMALSRAEEREIGARLERDGHELVDWVRQEGEPGAYAMARVDGAEVYRIADGAPRVYASANHAKTAARQLRTDGWFPVEVPDEGGFVLLREPQAEGGRSLANRRMLEIGPAFLRPGDGAAPMSSTDLRALLQDVARQTVRESDASALAAARAARQAEQRPAGTASPRGQAEAAAAALDARAQEVDAVFRQQLAAGRITEADYRALTDTTAEARAADRAKGLEAAAACLIANGALS